MSSDSIYDLDTVVKTWAWKVFGQDRKHSSSLKGYKRDDVTINLQWDGVTFTALDDDTIFTKTKQLGVPDQKVVFKSTFNNNTDVVQQHALKTERTTVVSQRMCVTKGFKCGANFGLKIGVPKDVAMVSAGANMELTLGSSMETSTSHSLTWSSDGTINVPGKSRVTAQMEVKEEEYECNFETRVKIEGRMVAKLKLPKEDDKTIFIAKEDIAQIIKQQVSHNDVSIQDNDRTAIWTITGTCYFRYGIEQIINTRAEPIETKSIAHDGD